MSVGPTRVLACALMAAALMAPVIDGGAIVRAQAGQANQTNQATPNAQGATSPGSAQPGQAPGAAPQTPEQQVAAALGVRGSAKAVQRQVANMLDEARRQRDIIRVTCLDFRGAAFVGYEDAEDILVHFGDLHAKAQAVVFPGTEQIVEHGFDPELLFVCWSHPVPPDDPPYEPASGRL